MPRPKKVQKAQKEYQVDLVMGDKTYKATGGSVLECLEQLKPDMIKSRGVLTAWKGDRSSRIIVRPIVIKRMMVMPVMRDILNKRLSMNLV